MPLADISDLPVFGADTVIRGIPQPAGGLASDEFPQMMDSDHIDNVIKLLDLDTADDHNNNDLPTSVDDMFALSDLPLPP